MQIVDETLSSLKIFNKEPGNINTEYHIRSKEKDNINTSIDDLNIQMINTEERVRHLEETKVLLETLKSYKLQEKKDFILRIINTALADIFNDKVVIDIEAQDNKTSKSSAQKYDIVFYQNDIEMARNEELLITNGGGIMQVISMLFKILIGYIYSKNTFYIFDESFSQLSGDNRARLSKFLKGFCDKFKFTLVVVSQVQDLDEHADVIYDVDGSYNNQGVRTLSIVDKKLPDDLAEGEGYWNLDIHNFQSIERQSFQFKGYTIIRGPNNSGKSASLRAINSILYNSFDVKKYPRKAISSTGAKKLLPTNIKLSKIKKEGNTENRHEIELKFTNSKVSFVIEGNEYYGKNLASEKLREAVENIGFKYINLKEFYKNFKGNLKDQTERIASTTQYDSLFLVGNKGSETEKVFNFLFNTENISMAILKIKEDMVLLNKDYMQAQETVLSKTERLNQLEKEINILGMLFYILSTQEYLNLHEELAGTQSQIDKLQIGIDTRNNYIEKAGKIIPLLMYEDTSIDYLTYAETEIKEIDLNISQSKLRLIDLDKILIKAPEAIEKINFCTDLETKILELEGYDIQDINNQVRQLNLKIEKIDEFQAIGLHFNYIQDSLEYYHNMNTIIKEDEGKIQELKTQQEDLRTKYNIHSCDKCSGHGYTHYHEKEI